MKMFTWIVVFLPSRSIVLFPLLVSLWRNCFSQTKTPKKTHKLEKAHIMENFFHTNFFFDKYLFAIRINLFMYFFSFMSHSYIFLYKLFCSVHIREKKVSFFLLPVIFVMEKAQKVLIVCFPIALLPYIQFSDFYS